MALTDNLVGYYKLDEASGNASDSVAGNTMTNNGSATYASAKINNGVVLNGSSQYLTAGNSSLFNFERTDPFSFSFWVKSNSTAYFEPVAKNVTSGSYNGYHSGMSVANNELWMSLINNAGVNEATIKANPSPSLATSTWYHIVITYSGSSNVAGIKFYVNGTEQTSRTTIQNNLTASISTSVVCQIGGRGGANYLLNGNLDELGIWSRALSSGEISTLYNGGAGLAYPFSTYNPAIGRRRLLV